MWLNGNEWAVSNEMDDKWSSGSQGTGEYNDDCPKMTPRWVTKQIILVGE